MRGGEYLRPDFLIALWWATERALEIETCGNEHPLERSILPTLAWLAHIKLLDPNSSHRPSLHYD